MEANFHTGSRTESGQHYVSSTNRIQQDEYTNAGGVTTITKYAFDREGEILADLDNANSIQTRYVRDDAGQVVGRIASSTVNWLLPDHRGSIRNVMNNSGSLIATVAYDAFGNITSESSAASTGNFGFTGLLFNHESGLVHAFWRELSPGSWSQEDPMRFDAGDTNLYRYVNNQPVQATDPSGKLIIFIHGIRDTADGWMKELYWGMVKYWKEHKNDVQIGVPFNWEGAGKLFLNKDGTPDAFDAQSTIANTLKRKGDAKAVDDLMNRVKDIRALLDNNGAAKEPIFIVAHSQGTMITLAALSKGMKIDGAVFLHSTLDKDAGKKENLSLQQAFGNVAHHIMYVYDRIDQAVTLINHFPKGSNGVPDVIKEQRKEGKVSRYVERETPDTVFDHIPLLRLIGRGFANHATMTLPSYGYRFIAKDMVKNMDIDYSYGGYLRLSKGLDLYKNKKILQGLGTYYQQEEVKDLQFNEKLGIWTVPK